VAVAVLGARVAIVAVAAITIMVLGRLVALMPLIMMTAMVVAAHDLAEILLPDEALGLHALEHLTPALAVLLALGDFVERQSLRGRAARVFTPSDLRLVERSGNLLAAR
jgi:hypothetical protein